METGRQGLAGVDWSRQMPLTMYCNRQSFVGSSKLCSMW